MISNTCGSSFGSIAMPSKAWHALRFAAHFRHKLLNLQLSSQD